MTTRPNDPALNKELTMNPSEIHIGKHYKGKDGSVKKVLSINSDGLIQVISEGGNEYVYLLTRFAEWAESEVVKT